MNALNVFLAGLPFFGVDSVLTCDPDHPRPLRGLQLPLNTIPSDFPDPWSIFAYLRPNGSLQQDVRPIQPSYRCCIDLGLGSWSSDAQQCCRFHRPRQDDAGYHVATMSQHVPTCPSHGQKCHDDAMQMPQVPHASCSPTSGAPRAQRLQLLQLRARPAPAPAPAPAPPALRLPRPWAVPR